jgi:hypothetical protein
VRAVGYWYDGCFPPRISRVRVLDHDHATAACLAVSAATERGVPAADHRDVEVFGRCQFIPSCGPWQAAPWWNVPHAFDERMPPPRALLLPTPNTLRYSQYLAPLRTVASLGLRCERGTSTHGLLASRRTVMAATMHQNATAIASDRGADRRLGEEYG